MHHGVDEYHAVMNDQERCHESFWMVIGGEIVLETWKRNCSRVLNFVCEVVGSVEAGVSGGELVGVNSDVELAAVWVDYGECGEMVVGKREVWVSRGEVSGSK